MLAGRPLLFSRNAATLNASARRAMSSFPSYQSVPHESLSNSVYLASKRLADISTRSDHHRVTSETTLGRLSEQFEKCMSNCVLSARGRDLTAQVGWGTLLEELSKTSIWENVKNKTNVLGQVLLLIGSDSAELKTYKAPGAGLIRPVSAVKLVRALVGTKAFAAINRAAHYDGEDKVGVDSIASVLKNWELRMTGVTQFEADEHHLDYDSRLYRLLYESGQVMMACDSDALLFPLRDRKKGLRDYLDDDFTLYDHPSPFSQFAMKTVCFKSVPTLSDYYAAVVKLSEWAMKYQPCSELDFEKNISPRVILLLDLGHSDKLRVARFRVPYHPKTIAIVIRGLNPADMIPNENDINFWFNKLKESLY